MFFNAKEVKKLINEGKDMTTREFAVEINKIMQRNGFEVIPLQSRNWEATLFNFIKFLDNKINKQMPQQ